MKKRYDIISYHPRRHHNFEQAEGISKDFSSFKHITSIHFSSSLLKLVAFFSNKASKSLSKRSYNFTKKNLLILNPWPELKTVIGLKFGRKADYNSPEFAQWIIKNIHPPKVFLSFDSVSRNIFKAWKGKSFLVLDLVIGLPQYRAYLESGKEDFSAEDLKKRHQGFQNLYSKYQDEVDYADLILCGSEFVKKTCLKFGVDENKLKVIPYGVELEKFNNADKEYKKGGKNLKFVFIGTAGYRKGANTLLEAWKEFVTKNDSHHLHFYGTKEVNYLDDIPNVHFHGHINQIELIEELRTADIMVFPTTFEGSAYSIYQAMAMKLTVITTENSGTVLKNGESAFIVQVSDVDALVNSMQNVVDNEALRILFAEKGYQESLKYTWENYSKKLNIVLQDVLNKIEN